MARCAANDALPLFGGIYLSFIFLLHPYSFPAITKIRRVQTSRERHVEGYWHWKF
jgi:hypothetical protein